MFKNLTKCCVIAGLIMTAHFSLPTSSAQDTTEQFPESFFMGKWGGYISGAIVDTPCGFFPFEIKLGGIPVEHPIGPYGGGASFYMIMSGSWPTGFSYSDTTNCGILLTPESTVFTFTYPADAPGLMAYSAMFSMSGFAVQVIHENLISLAHGGDDPEMWEDSYAFGELGSISVLSDTLGKTIEINEPVETDGFTQRVITVEDVGDFVVDTNSEIVFNTETEIELSIGKVRTIVDRLGSRRIRVRSPQAICGVRGTTFVVEVENDGTDVVIVLEGEVEFSDKANGNTVIVGQNQRSTCEPGGFPSEPESINPDEIIKWWE